MTPEQLGQLHGRMFAAMAVQLRRKGLEPGTWCEYMNHRIASLSVEHFEEQADLDVWVKTLMETYQGLIDNHIEGLALLLDDVQGRA